MDKTVKAFVVLAHRNELDKISGDGTITVEDVNRLHSALQTVYIQAERAFSKSTITVGPDLLQARNCILDAIHQVEDAIKEL